MLAKTDTETAAAAEFAAAGARSVATGRCACDIEIAMVDARHSIPQVQTHLAHTNRLATMGEFTASIVHEVSQPIVAASMNADAALRFLNQNPPDIEKLREALGHLVNDTDRARDIIGWLRDFLRRAHPYRSGAWNQRGDPGRHQAVRLGGGEEQRFRADRTGGELAARRGRSRSIAASVAKSDCQCHPSA